MPHPYTPQKRHLSPQERANPSKAQLTPELAFHPQAAPAWGRPLDGCDRCLRRPSHETRTEKKMTWNCWWAARCMQTANVGKTRKHKLYQLLERISRQLAFHKQGQWGLQQEWDAFNHFLSFLLSAAHTISIRASHRVAEHCRGTQCAVNSEWEIHHGLLAHGHHCSLWYTRRPHLCLSLPLSVCCLFLKQKMSVYVYMYTYTIPHNLQNITI